MRRKTLLLIIGTTVVGVGGLMTTTLPIESMASAEGPTCAGDFDLDGEVGVLDLLFMLGEWGTCIAGECADPFLCGGEISTCPNDPSCFCLFDKNGEGVCGSDGWCPELEDCPFGNCPPGFVCAAFTCCDPPEKCVPDCFDPPAEGGPRREIQFGDHTIFGIAGVDYPLRNFATAGGLSCEADLDLDGEVGVLDLLALLGAWGPCE